MRTREPKNLDKEYQKKDKITTRKKAAERKKERELANQVALAQVIAQAKLSADTCPACQEKALQIDEAKNAFSCKSCRKRGNVIRFTRLAINLTERKAISYLKELSPSSSTPSPPKKTPLKEKISPPATPTTANPKPISQIELDRLKKEISLLDLMKEEGLEFRKVGKDFFSRCPFHEDKTPSLSVSPNNLFHCFSCGRGGSVIDWVTKNKNISFLEAVNLLGEKYPHLQSCSSSSSPIVTKKSSSPVAKAENSSPYQTKLLKQTSEYYHQSLLQNPRALEYLAKRGIDNSELIQQFQIGFADRSLGPKIPKKKSKGGEVREQLEEIGLFRSSGHEFFAGSIVIPIISPSGEITEMYGRKINDHIRAGTPSHLYLPGPHRGIFNPSCLKSEQIILCESLIDALSFWAQGFRYVTASYGTQGFTNEYFLAFQQHKPKIVYIAYDNDEAGNKAALKLAEKLISIDIDCLRVTFPSNQDANAFVCQAHEPKEKLQELLDKAIDMRQYFSSLAVKTKEEETTKKEKSEGLAARYRITPTKKDQDSIEIQLEERCYRIRGFSNNLSANSMRINLRIRLGDRFHVDNLELYHARQRGAFAKIASQELGINFDVVKEDVNRILLNLEEWQKEEIEKAFNPKPQKKELSAREKQEALQLLQSPNLLDRIISDFERCGIVGEKTNLLTSYIALTSRKLNEPLAIIVQATSGSGKTSLMNAALSFMPEEELVKYTAMTGQSLFYMGEDNLVHKVLAISEEEGAEKAGYALKILQSEKSLCIASTGKDPKSGRFITHEYKVKGPVMIIMTTTSIEIDEELQNRCLILTVNENREQTQIIQQLQRERQTLEGMLQQQDRDSILTLHQNAQTLLEPVLVVNPYAKQLTFLDSRLRMRRDHMKYLTLIKAIALLHQHQRPRKTARHQGKDISYIEANLKDIETANQIVSQVMGISLDELAPQTRRFLVLLEKMVKEHSEQTQTEPSQCHFSRKEIREYTGWTDFQVRTHIHRLVEMEYVLVHNGRRGKNYVYELLYQGQGQKGNPFLLGLIDVRKLTTSMPLRGAKSPH